MHGAAQSAGVVRTLSSFPFRTIVPVPPGTIVRNGNYRRGYSALIWMLTVYAVPCTPPIVATPL
jgi:hypothetical protein